MVQERRKDFLLGSPGDRLEVEPACCFVESPMDRLMIV